MFYNNNAQVFKIFFMQNNNNTNNNNWVFLKPNSFKVQHGKDNFLRKK
jgi:hypothetical protein